VSAAPRRLVHLVRAAATAEAIDLLHDWVVRDRAGAWILDAGGPPPPAPLTPGPLDDEALVQLLFAADAVVVW